ncbi:MAG: hypothetical protein ACAH83_09005 [Alphaproteobacteria bacterium]
MKAGFTHKAKPRRALKGLAAVFLTAVMVGLGGCNPAAEEQQNTPPKPAVTLVEPAPAAPPSAPETPVCAPLTSVAAHTAREMTAGEAALAKALFNGELKTDCLRLNFFGAMKNATEIVLKDEENHIQFYGKDAASADYSQEKNTLKFRLFVRGLTHLWQNQTGFRETLGDPEDTLYPLDSQYVFASYGKRQQPAIMEDYALRFLHPSRKSYWLPKDYGGDRSDTDPFLQELVEGNFPSAKAAREAFANIESRDLTPGEEALLKGIFGDALNTTGLKQNFHPESFKDIVGSASSGAAAEYWGAEQKSPDFSKEKEANRFGTFMHENAHVWQFQTNWQYFPRFEEDEVEDPKDPEKAYRYPLDTKFKFTDYGVEQQAAIIEDYARYYLHPGKTLWYLPKVYGRGEQMQARLPLLRKVVEDQFPAAKTARETFERTGALPKPKIASAQKTAKPPVAPG